MIKHFVPLLAVAALAPGAAGAQSGGDTARLREALRASTAQVRALEDEKASWAARELELKKEIDALRAASKGGTRTSQREVAELRQQVAERGEAAGKVSEALARCEAARADTTRVADEERGRAAERATDLSARLAAAEASNEQMYRVAKETFDWIDHVGVAAALWAREPFVGRRRVELENALQEKEDRLLEARLRPDPRPDPAPGARTARAPSAQ